jgi:hypothetical protein
MDTKQLAYRYRPIVWCLPITRLPLLVAHRYLTIEFWTVFTSRPRT